MLGGIILMYIDAHFSHGRRLPDVSFKVSTSSRPLTQIALLLGFNIQPVHPERPDSLNFCLGLVVL